MVDSAAAQSRTDFYSLVHKGLRKTLFDAVILAGTTDYGDPVERARLSKTVRDVATLLREHARHEKQFLHPIIAESAPQRAEDLDTQHEAHDRALADLEQLFETATTQGSGGAGHAAYRALAQFTSDFLRHLEEEEAGQPELWETVAEARLEAGMSAFKRSQTVEQAVASWGVMLPALNAAERAAMFRGILR